MKKKVLLAFCFVLFAFSAFAQQKVSISSPLPKEFAWLEGEWKATFTKSDYKQMIIEENEYSDVQLSPAQIEKTVSQFKGGTDYRVKIVKTGIYFELPGIKSNYAERHDFIITRDNYNNFVIKVDEKELVGWGQYQKDFMSFTNDLNSFIFSVQLEK